MRLRPVDATKEPSRFARAYAAMAATRPARFVSRHVNWKLDPLLLRITGGRFASTLVYPTALLETYGARTGRLRRNAVIYFDDGDRFVIIASNAGAPTHPSWLHNLRARPDDVSLGGVTMTASEVDDESERKRLWTLADRVFPAFASYRADAAATSRRIPIVALVPHCGTDTASAPGTTPTFIYDGECGFCRRWVGWLERHLPSDVDYVPYQQLAGLETYGLTAEDVSSASYWIDAAGTPHRGAASFSHALERAAPPWRALGSFLRAPVARDVARIVYGFIARNRHRLPAPGDP